MSLDNTDALIDHLDKDFAGANKEVSPETVAAIARLIAEDEETAKEWAYLQRAVEAVQEAGLYQQVASVRQMWDAQTATIPPPQKKSDIPALADERRTEGAAEDQATGENQSGATVRNLNRNMMRAAAVLLAMVAGSAIFKYVRLSSSSLYSEYFTSYELNTSRGAGDQDAIEQAYTARNWSQVLAIAAGDKVSNNKAEFLAGMADLELKKFDDAIDHFELVIASNTHSGQDYFEDEAEYYLAMSWLAKRKVNEAMPILEKIRANKSHLYHDKVEKMSFTDLRLVQYKENK